MGNELLQSVKTNANHWVVAHQSVVDIGNNKKDLAYAVFEGSTLFPDFQSASQTIMELGLPLGWVAIEASRLINTEQPSVPMSNLQWCTDCGEGYVNFCRSGGGDKLACPMKPTKQRTDTERLDFLSKQNFDDLFMHHVTDDPDSELMFCLKTSGISVEAYAKHSTQLWMDNEMNNEKIQKALEMLSTIREELVRLKGSFRSAESSGFLKNFLEDMLIKKDCTPKLHVGSSSFEDWFQAHEKASTGDKQLARDSYSARMGDPLVTYATTKLDEPNFESMRARTLLAHLWRKYDDGGISMGR